jgi:hypothetical protein
MSSVVPFVKDICLTTLLAIMFPPAASVFCVLFSVVLMDVIVMLLLYAPLVCMFPRCWFSQTCVSHP